MNPPFLLNLPSHILFEHFLLNLDLSSLLSLFSTCRTFYQLSKPSLWRNLLLRDYSYYLVTSPLPDDLPPFTLSQLNYIHESKEESILNYESDYKPTLSEAQSLLIKDFLLQETDYKLTYKNMKHLKKGLRLEGIWVGDYLVHGNEKLRLLQMGYEIWAIKLTGDPNIPAKKTTWKVKMKKDWSYGRGLIHLADDGFINPRWGPVEIMVIADDRIIVCGYYHYENVWLKVSLGCKKMLLGNETPFMSAKFEPVFS